MPALFAELEMLDPSDDDRGALIEPADEVEGTLPVGSGEGEVTEFVDLC